MDIEEERPTDGPDCGSPNGNQPDCRPGEEKHCEWDYLRIITGEFFHSSFKSNFLQKFFMISKFS